MAPTALSWFYHAPEPRPYFIAERVNNTFWDSRISSIYLHVTRAESPIEMAGAYGGARVRMEWEPAKWLRLTTQPEAPALVTGLSNILRFKPSLRYETPGGDSVWEWWVEGLDKRWQEIQGRPSFRQPKRLATGK